MPPENPIPTRFQAAILEVVHELVVRNFAGLVADARAPEWTPEILEKTVDLYPGTLVELPESVWDDSDADAVYFKRGNFWDVMVPLWTFEKGRSDLTLQMDISETECEIILEIREIHVL